MLEVYWYFSVSEPFLFVDFAFFLKGSSTKRIRFSRKGSAEIRGDFFPNKFPGEFSGGFFVDFWGAFSLGKQEEKSTQKFTAKFKSEFESFAAKIHTARIWPC